jgi:hypothetical protein
MALRSRSFDIVPTLGRYAEIGLTSGSGKPQETLRFGVGRYGTFANVPQRG